MTIKMITNQDSTRPGSPIRQFDAPSFCAAAQASAPKAGCICRHFYRRPSIYPALKATLNLGLVLLCFLGPVLCVQADVGGLLKKAFGPAPVHLDESPAVEKSVSVDSFKQMKDCKKVVVTSFNVQFLTQKKASASAGSDNDGAAHVNSDIKLTGHDNETFQAITDQAYTNFIKGLTTLGVEVQPYSEYMALPQYADMKSYLKTSPLEVSGGMFSGGQPSILFAPTGMPVSLFGDETAVSTGALMSSGMGRSAPHSLEPQIAKESGVAAVHVYLVVDFCQMESKGGVFSYTASVDAKPQISIAKISRCLFVFGGGMTGGLEYVKMKNNAFGKDSYVTEFNDVTTTGQKLGDAAGDLIGILDGKGGTYKTRSYVAVADAPQYQAAAVKYLTAVEDLMLAGIKAKTAK